MCFLWLLSSTSKKSSKARKQCLSTLRYSATLEHEFREKIVVGMVHPLQEPIPYRKAPEAPCCEAFPRGRGCLGAASPPVPMSTLSPIHPLLAHWSRLGGRDRCPTPGGCRHNQRHHPQGTLPLGSSPRHVPWSIPRFQGENPARIGYPWQRVHPQGRGTLLVLGQQGCSRVGRKQSREPCKGQGFRSYSVMKSSAGRLLSAWEDWHRRTSRIRQVTVSILAFGGAGLRGVGHGQSPPRDGNAVKTN